MVDAQREKVFLEQLEVFAKVAAPALLVGRKPQPLCPIGDRRLRNPNLVDDVGDDAIARPVDGDK